MVQETPRNEGDQSFLLIRSGRLTCAIPASEVVRIVRGLTCHPVPVSDAHFLGLAQYGGDPLPVLDLHTLVEGQASGRRHHSTVILGRRRSRSHLLVGLAIDEALRVVSIGTEPSTDQGDSLVGAVVEMEGEAVKVLRTELLLREEAQKSEAGDG